MTKENTLEVLQVVENLKNEAYRNKEEYNRTIEELKQIVDKKSTLENEAEAIQEVINTNIYAFQKVANDPNFKDKMAGKV